MSELMRFVNALPEKRATCIPFLASDAGGLLLVRHGKLHEIELYYQYAGRWRSSYGGSDECYLVYLLPFLFPVVLIRY